MFFGVLFLHRWWKKIILGVIIDHCLGKNLIIFVAFTGCQFFFHKGSNLIHVQIYIRNVIRPHVINS